MEQTQGLALQQTLSPQMQQSLHILQAPLIELRQMVSAELQQNPMIEEEVPRDLEPAERTSNQDTLEDAWSPYYEQSGGGYSSEAQERRQFFFDSLTRAPSLREALTEQLALIPLTPEERSVAVAILGNIDESGYLAVKPEEIAAPLRTTPLQVEEVLERLQEKLEPAGIGARNLKECLLLQLRRTGREQSLDYRVVEGHLDQLARRKFQEIARELKVTAPNVQQSLENISRLDPRPGHQFSSEPDQIIVADVFVRLSEDGEYEVYLNQRELPHLRISNTYKDLMGLPGADNREMREYLRDKLRGGRFFLRSLEQRNQTILSIAKEIVARQREFFDHGPSQLKPMTMGQVAEAVGVHETTVSRAVSGKYMDSPQGLFELKYFFTAGYLTAEGQTVSNESVRQTIADLVAEENPMKPLSDQDMVEILEERGIPVARRTIAKYRDQLGILPSHLRKRG